jgi:hypothetical protein
MQRRERSGLFNDLINSRFYACSVDGRQIICVLRTGGKVMKGKAQVGLLGAGLPALGE